MRKTRRLTDGLLDSQVIEERSEVVAKSLRGVGGRLQGHVCFSVPQHVWDYDSVSCCDPGTYLVSPTVPQVGEAMETKQGCSVLVVSRSLIYVVIRPASCNVRLAVAEIVYHRVRVAVKVGGSATTGAAG